MNVICSTLLAGLALLLAVKQQLQQYDRYCPNGQQCYIIPSQKSWSSAQQWCKSMNSTLPIVDDLGKQMELLEAMESLGLTEIWIGATAVYDEWTWVDGTKFGNNLSLHMDPGNFVAGMYKYTSGVTTPHGVRAIDISNFICQFSDPEACNKTQSVPREDGCYISMYDNYMPWFSARNHCLEIGGDLATFHNVSDASALVKYDEPIPLIGLRNRWWNWNCAVTGTLKEVLFTQWTNGSEPNNTKGFDCISTTSNGWKEANCTHKLAFICQEDNVFLPDIRPVPTDDARESTPQIVLCKNVGIAVGLGVGIPLIVIVVILIAVIVHRNKLRTEKPVYSTTICQNKSTNESVANVTRNILPEQNTQYGRTYEGLDNTRGNADDEAYEALDVK